MRMRRAVQLLLAVSLLSGNALADSLVCKPESTSLTIPGGAHESLTVTVEVADPHASTYYLWFIGSIANGNLPASWLSLAPSRTFITRSSSGTSTLTISVPPGTPSGTYSGYLIPKAQASHTVIDPGKGCFLDVKVPPVCSGVPTFDIISFGPDLLWPPDHSMQEVVVAGRAELPSGCSLLEMGYAIEDEYNVYTAVGTIPIRSDGTFSLTLPVEASRVGQDKDGRHYTISLYARDEAGIGTRAGLVVVVPHDKGNR